MSHSEAVQLLVLALAWLSIVVIQRTVPRRGKMFAIGFSVSSQRPSLPSSFLPSFLPFPINAPALPCPRPCPRPARAWRFSPGGYDRRDGRFVGGQVPSYLVITEYYVIQTCPFALVGREHLQMISKHNSERSCIQITMMALPKIKPLSQGYVRNSTDYFACIAPQEAPEGLGCEMAHPMYQLPLEHLEHC